MIEHMEMAGIRVVNPCYAFRRARDKYATQYMLASAGLPVPLTFTTDGSEPWNPAYRTGTNTRRSSSTSGPSTMT